MNEQFAPSYWCSLSLFIAAQLVDFPEASGPKELHYDAEWLAVLRTTHQLMSLQRRPVTLPGARLEQWSSNQSPGACKQGWLDASEITQRDCVLKRPSCTGLC